MAIEGVGAGHLVVLAVALLIGSTVQGVSGLGVGLLVAPVAGLVEPSLLPGLPLMFALLYPLLTLRGEFSHVDWHGIRWSIPPRIAGTVVGVAVVATISTRMIGIAVAVIVLIAVAVSWSTLSVPISRRSLGAAGFVSGITGTATSIGGPPMALLYQHAPPARLRATLGVYFVAGAMLSIVGLGLSGSLHARDVRIALLLSPILLLGLVLSRVLHSRVNAGSVRAAMLTTRAVSSVVLLARSITF